MNISSMYRELFLTSIVLNFMDALLTGMAAFCVSYFVVSFIKLDVLIALFFAICVFIFSLVSKIRENKILVLESHYPNLKERLRTSFDYQNKNNTVINDLHSDIVTMIRKIDINTFLSPRGVALKVASIFAVLFLIIYTSSVGFDALYIRRGIVNSAPFKTASNILAKLTDETREEVKDRPRLAEPRLIQVSDMDMNLSIEAYTTELDIREIREPELDDFGGRFPSSIAGAAQETYEEKIPEEHREVIKEYFRKINR